MHLKSTSFALACGFDIRPRIQADEPWALSRCACLGNDVIKILGRGNPKFPKVLNYQKLRVDGFLDNLHNQKFKRGIFRAIQSTTRGDIRVCIGMQMNRIYYRQKTAPNFIVMDDFSELTDSSITLTKSGFRFFANISDLRSELRSSNDLAISGLFDLSELERHYFELFTEFQRLWGQVPIIFIHFPTKLDSRDLYKTRSLAIRSAIAKLTLEFKNLTQIEIPDVKVEFSETPDGHLFPYHFNDELYPYVAEQMAQVLAVSR
jgi:hypothetical protein